MKLLFLKDKFTYNSPYCSWTIQKFQAELDLEVSSVTVEPPKKKQRSSAPMKLLEQADPNDVKRVLIDMMKSGKLPLKIETSLNKALAATLPGISKSKTVVAISTSQSDIRL